MQYTVVDPPKLLFCGISLLHHLKLFIKIHVSPAVTSSDGKVLLLCYVGKGT